MKNIVRVAQAVPEVKIWMPTREVEILRKVLRQLGAFPSNLIPRVSSPKVDGKPLKGFQYTSTVVSDPATATCIAQLQKNNCDGEVGSCRACWEDDHVSYPLH